MSTVAAVLAYRRSCVAAHERALRWTLDHLAWCRAEGHDRHAASASLQARQHARHLTQARRWLRDAEELEAEELALF